MQDVIYEIFLNLFPMLIGFLETTYYCCFSAFYNVYGCSDQIFRHLSRSVIIIYCGKQVVWLQNTRNA